MPKTSIEFSAPKDSVIKYVKEIEGNNLTEISKNEFLLFDDKQAFITKESLKENTDKKPYRWLYTHEGSLASLWNLKFISVNDQQSKIELEIKTVLTNPKIESAISNDKIINQDELWKLIYENKELISRGIIENIYENYINSKLLPILHSVNFSREKGYDNKNYQFSDFIPKTDIKATILLNKNVPENGEGVSKKSILVYDRIHFTLNLIDYETGKIIWTKQLENYDSQNSNEYHVYKNTIYLATGSGFIYAISLKDGEIYWQSSPIKITKENKQTNFFNQELPISDDYIFANYNGTVYKINRYNGKFEWSQTIGNYGHYNYSFDEKNLYKTGILECFVINKKTGEVEKIINNSKGNTFYSPHAYNDENKIIVLNSIGYNLLTDKILWKQNISMDYLFLENESIYATNNVASSVYKLDIKTGKILWQNNELKSNNTKVEDLYNLKNEVLIDRISNFYSENEKVRQLIFLDKKSGELNLILTIGDKIISKPTIYQNKIYLLTPDKILVYDIDTKERTEINANLSTLDLDQKTYYDHFIQVFESN